MSDWTAGYVADIEYTYGYYADLDPQRIKLAFLNAGKVCPDIVSACELGFGQGVTVNTHAAGSDVKWYGTDFNPSQAAFAQEMADASGGGAQLSDQAFEEFASRDDLPEFDYIAMHGIWSWISDDNRHVIVDFIRRKLKVGGVLYISYNTLPGWSAFAPVRHLLAEHANVMGQGGVDTASQVSSSVEFVGDLLKVNPSFANANPQIQERAKGLKNQDAHYLAHEYFNQDWIPMHFGTIAKWLEQAKLSFVCSARLLDHINAVNLKKEQQAFLASIPNPSFRESVRDFIVNRQFRGDYWVKGPRELNQYNRDEALRNTRVLLVVQADKIPTKVTGNLGAVPLLEKVYKPVAEAMSDHTVRTLGDIEKAVSVKGINFAQLVEAILIFVAGGQVGLVQDEAKIKAAQENTEKLNQYIMDKARGSNQLHYLVSPVTGAAVQVQRFYQLFLLGLSQGKSTPNQLGKFGWETLEGRGLKVISDGKMLESPKENLAYLQSEAKTFHAEALPIYEALKLI